MNSFSLEDNNGFSFQLEDEVTVYFAQFVLSVPHSSFFVTLGEIVRIYHLGSTLVEILEIRFTQ